MRTYTSPLGGWAGGYALLAGLALVVGCASSVAAQQRKYLVELGAAPGYQTFDKETVLAAWGSGCRSTSRSKWKAGLPRPTPKTTIRA